MEKITKLMNDSGWSERTITARIAFVKSIKNHIDPDGNNLNFLKDFNAVSKFILDSTKNPSTIKTKILTIKAILKLFDDKAAMKYEKLAHTVIEKADTYKGNNVAKDENKVISYEQMLEIPYIIEDNIKYVYDKLFLSPKDIDALKSINAKNKYLRLLTDYIIAVLYCWQPPVRADYGVASLKQSKTENWYNANKGIIYFNDFKNVKSFGVQEFKLDKVIKDNLNEYISILDYIFNESNKIPLRLLYMVGTKDYKEFSREKFSIYFSRIMNYYTKKKLTINSFRHCYENYIIKSPEYNKLTINEKKLIHNRLLHSWTTGQEYLTVDK